MSFFLELGSGSKDQYRDEWCHLVSVLQSCWRPSLWDLRLGLWLASVLSGLTRLGGITVGATFGSVSRWTLPFLRPSSSPNKSK